MTGVYSSGVPVRILEGTLGKGKYYIYIPVDIGAKKETESMMMQAFKFCLLLANVRRYGILVFFISGYKMCWVIIVLILP